MQIDPTWLAAAEAATTQAREAIRFDWAKHARADQLPPPGDWLTWLLMAGRGFGKTRTGAEWVRMMKDRVDRIALVAPTAGDVRDVMVEGESGLLAISPPWDRPIYEPSKRRLTWPNGAQATTYSADEPERLRGPQHAAGWCDELASWRYPEAWDMLMFGMRLGDRPRVVVTTTPKPIKLVRSILADPRTVVTRGSTFANATNLADTFIQQVRAKYEGTRLGRQELYGEVLNDMPGALWTQDMIEKARRKDAPPPMRRVVVAIDPAVSSNEGSDETGIVVAGIDGAGLGYVLADLSGKYTPDAWAAKAIEAFHTWKADRIVAEVNQGGDMVEATLRTQAALLPFKGVHASKGKFTRAEPVAALYEQERIRHCGMFAALEDQMTTFTQDIDRKAMGSPDRVDALVWAFTELMVDFQARPVRAVRLNHMTR